MKRTGYSRFTLLLKIIAAFLLVALLAGLFSPHINPYHFWPAAFFGLAFPASWLLSMLIALFLFRHKKWFVMLMVLVLAGLPLMLRHFSLPLEKRGLPSAAYGIITYNVHGFAGIRQGKSSYERQALVHDFINEHGPAVVCMQEYPMKSRKHARYMERLNQDLDLEFKHISDFDPESKGTSYVFLTASKYPVINRGTVFTMDAEICGIFTDIRLPEGTVRVYNVHLQSVRLFGEKKLLRPHRNPGAVRHLFSYISGTFQKLMKAFPVRAYQAWMIRKSIAMSPHPVIICGDFNDTPASYVYETIRKGLKDAAISHSLGFNRTYAESIYPLRIDHILIDRRLKITGYERKKIYLSDHFPAIAGFGFKQDR